jgi:hypothetical protein
MTREDSMGPSSSSDTPRRTGEFPDRSLETSRGRLQTPLRVSETFDRLVNVELVPFFRERDWKKKALNFHRAVAGNAQVIQLQRRQASSAAGVSFTVNVSHFSSRLNAALRRYTWAPSVKEVPKEPECQIRSRLGNLAPEPVNDRWWDVSNATDTAELGRELRHLLERDALPFLEEVATDEKLRDFLLRGGRRFVSSGPLDLPVLLLELGPREELAERLERLRQGTGPQATRLLASIDKLIADVRLSRGG